MKFVAICSVLAAVVPPARAVFEIAKLIPPVSCEFFDRPERLDRLIWAEPEDEAVENAAQFCQEEGYNGVSTYEIDFPCDDNDESSFADYDGSSWVFKSTPSKNRCYLMFKSITCCSGCINFNNPRRLEKEIWAEPQAEGLANAVQFCREMGFTGVSSSSQVDFPCEDNDESTFVEYDGSDWVFKNSPSKNRCYRMWKNIQCCPDCDTFTPPKRLGKSIWAEPYVTGYRSLNQFCQEQGYLHVVESSVDYPCKSNRRQSFAQYGTTGWKHRRATLVNRCHRMWKSVKCCGNLAPVATTPVIQTFTVEEAPFTRSDRSP